MRAAVRFFSKGEKMELIQTGKIVNTHGIHGELKVISWARSPEDLLGIETFYIEDKPYEVEKARIHKGSVLLKFCTVTNIDDAAVLKNRIIYADKEDFDLEDTEYFIEDLIGIRVIDADTGEDYGKIGDVLETGANDVYEVVDTEGKTRLVPAIKDCIVSTDIKTKIMKIRPLPGLFDI